MTPPRLRPFRVALDFDGVICSLREGIRKYHPCSDSEYRLPAGAYAAMIKCLKNPLFYVEDCPPIEGAIAGMRELLARGDDVVIVTSSASSSAPQSYEGKIRWLAKWIPEFNLNNVVTATRKYLVDADVLVDDRQQNIEEWAARQRAAIVVDYPWNANLAESVHIQRCCDWGAIVSAIDALARDTSGVPHATA
jgi:5'(3')-deoxyribonucleotidase